MAGDVVPNRARLLLFELHNNGYGDIIDDVEEIHK